jgi:hypothetical protein
LALAFRCNEDDDYEAAVVRCEHHIEINVSSRLLIVRAGLQYSKKSSDGPHGRALNRDIPELHLLRDDRLEPSPALPDVGAFESLALGTIVTFWRNADDTLTRHRNPLFCAETGLSPKRNMTVDSLHCLYLGVMNAYVKLAIWLFIDAGVLGGLGTKEERVQSNVITLRHLLTSWYKVRRQGGENLTEISDLTVGMVSGARVAKGAETWGLVLFFIHLLRRYVNHLGVRAHALLEAGECLEGIVVSLRGHGWVVPAALQQRCLDLYSRHMSLLRPDDAYTPKHHQYFHLLFRIAYQGNPQYSAVWTDESLNKKLKGSCRNAPQPTFERNVLLQFREVLANLDA